MANSCVCCGKNFGVMSGYRKLLKDSDEKMCDRCYAKFSEPLLRSASTIDEVKQNHNEAFRLASQCGFLPEGINYIKRFLTIHANKALKDISEADRSLRLKEAEEAAKKEAKEYMLSIKNILPSLRKEFLMTTGYSFEGYEIVSYIGVLTGSTVQGTGFFSETSAAVSDFFGVENSTFSDKLEIAKDSALSKLRDNAIFKKANALIGVDIDFVNFSGNMMGVIASGTAVKINKLDK